MEGLERTKIERWGGVNAPRFFSIYQKKTYKNGKREVYLCGIKILTYYRNRLIKEAMQKCCIDYKFLKKVHREKNLRLVHPTGIVISPKTQIGMDCTIYQNVTLGKKDELAPTLGDNVTIYANAVVVGDVHIGNNSVIGAGSVVLKDVPANEVWAGNPAHFIKKI